MSKLFSNGCSFLGPRPKDNVNTFVTKILAEQYNLRTRVGRVFTPFGTLENPKKIIPRS